MGKLLLIITLLSSYHLLAVNFINTTKGPIFFYMGKPNDSSVAIKFDKQIIDGKERGMLNLPKGEAKVVNLVTELKASKDGLNIYFIAPQGGVSEKTLCGNKEPLFSLQGIDDSNIAAKDKAATILVREEKGELTCTLSFD